MASHDRLARATVEKHRGTVVKMTGDGICAAFEDPFDAISATLELRRALLDSGATAGVALRVRCGLHAGIAERRDNDFFGTVVNRAARIMNSAHGGQTLLSQAAVLLLEGRLPADVTLRDLGYCASPRSHEPGTDLPARAPGSPGTSFRIAFAREHAEQPAAASDFVRGPRTRDRRTPGFAEVGPSRHADRGWRARQDATVAPSGGHRRRRFSRRRLAGRARADQGRAPRSAGHCVGARSQGGSRAPGDRSSVESCQGSATSSRPRQLRARPARLCGSRQADCCERHPGCRSSRPAASRFASAEKRRCRCRRSTFPRLQATRA